MVESSQRKIIHRIQTTTKPVTKNHRKSGLRIILGRQTTTLRIPWIVRIGDGECENFCGGALISNDLVLTAAHCHSDVNSLVTLGDTDCFEYDEGEITIKVKQWFDHDDYRLADNSKYALNDISIVMLAKKVKFSKAIQPICLPSKLSLEDLENKKATAAGWGDHEVNETRGEDWNSNLHEVSLEILPSEQCEILNEDIEYKGAYNSSNTLCVGDSDYINGRSLKAKSIWSGDSGGTNIIHHIKRNVMNNISTF